jgi:hypothetical protein
MSLPSRDHDVPSLLQLDVLNPRAMLPVRPDERLFGVTTLVVEPDGAVSEAGDKGSAFFLLGREGSDAAVGLSRDVLRIAHTEGRHVVSVRCCRRRNERSCDGMAGKGEGRTAWNISR